MAANRFGIDVGQLNSDIQASKAAEQNNALSAIKLKQAEYDVEQQPIKDQEERARNNAAAGLEVTKKDLREKALAGDEESKKRLLGIDPEGAAVFIKAANGMDEKQKETAAKRVEQMGRMTATVLNAAPERQKALYAQMREALPEEAKAKMPAEFDKNFLEISLAKLTPMATILKNPTSVKVGGEDILYQGGKEIDRKPTASKSPLVSVNTGGDKKESEKLAELRVTRLDEIQQKAIAATEQIESINQIKSIDMQTGLGVEAKGQIAKVWDSLGGDGEALTGVDPSDVEKFKAVATKQVLDIMATQKGPQTDQDAARIEKAVANLGNTKESNDFIMDAAIAIGNRKIEQSIFYEKFLEANGTLKGADAEWRDFKTKTPMVSEVVKNPDTGQPTFFYQFREKMSAKGYESKDIVEAWRRMNAGGN